MLSTVIGGPEGLHPAVQECLDRAGVDPAAIDLVIGEDGAGVPETIRSWARGAGIPDQRLLLDTERYGDAGTAAPLLALVDAVQAGRLRSGMTVLITSAGQGRASALACVKWGTR